MSNRTGSEAILEAARELFTTKGFAATTVREVCRAAGVTPPALYYHFGSKEGLFEAVVAKALTLDDFCTLLRDAVAAQKDPRDRLRAYVSTYLAHFPAQVLNPGLHLHNSTQLSPASLSQLGPGLEAIYELTREILQDGMAVGAFRDVDVDTAASCIMGAVDSFVRARAYLNVENDVDRVTACVVDLFTCGLMTEGKDGM